MPHRLTSIPAMRYRNVVARAKYPMKIGNDFAKNSRNAWWSKLPWDICLNTLRISPCFRTKLPAKIALADEAHASVARKILCFMGSPSRMENDIFKVCVLDDDPLYQMSLKCVNRIFRSQQGLNLFVSFAVRKWLVRQRVWEHQLNMPHSAIIESPED